MSVVRNRSWHVLVGFSSPVTSKAQGEVRTWFKDVEPRTSGEHEFWEC
jgi:hypothetical protein